MALTILEQAIEASTGESVDAIRSMPLDQWRGMVEKRFNARMRFISKSDCIRGTILRRHRGEVLSHDQVEEILDRALRK